MGISLLNTEGDKGKLGYVSFTMVVQLPAHVGRALRDEVRIPNCYRLTPVELRRILLKPFSHKRQP